MTREYKLGETFRAHGVNYKVVKNKKGYCEGCDFDGSLCHEHKCHDDERSDKTSVVFIATDMRHFGFYELDNAEHEMASILANYEAEAWDMLEESEGRDVEKYGIYDHGIVIGSSNKSPGITFH